MVRPSEHEWFKGIGRNGSRSEEATDDERLRLPPCHRWHGHPPRRFSGTRGVDPLPGKGESGSEGRGGVVAPAEPQANSQGFIRRHPGIPDGRGRSDAGEARGIGKNPGPVAVGEVVGIWYQADRPQRVRRVTVLETWGSSVGFIVLGASILLSAWLRSHRTQAIPKRRN